MSSQRNGPYKECTCQLCGKNGEDLKIYCVSCSSAAHPDCLESNFCSCWSPAVAREVLDLRQRVSILETLLEDLVRRSSGTLKKEDKVESNSVV